MQNAAQSKRKTSILGACVNMHPSWGQAGQHMLVSKHAVTRGLHNRRGKALAGQRLPPLHLLLPKRKGCKVGSWASHLSPPCSFQPRTVSTVSAQVISASPHHQPRLAEPAPTVTSASAPCSPFMSAPTCSQARGVVSKSAQATRSSRQQRNPGAPDYEPSSHCGDPGWLSGRMPG